MFFTKREKRAVSGKITENYNYMEKVKTFAKIWGNIQYFIVPRSPSQWRHKKFSHSLLQFTNYTLLAEKNVVFIISQYIMPPEIGAYHILVFLSLSE